MNWNPRKSHRKVRKFGEYLSPSSNEIVIPPTCQKTSNQKSAYSQNGKFDVRFVIFLPLNTRNPTRRTPSWNKLLRQQQQNPSLRQQKHTKNKEQAIKRVQSSNLHHQVFHFFAKQTKQKEDDKNQEKVQWGLYRVSSFSQGLLRWTSLWPMHQDEHEWQVSIDGT